MAKSYVGAPRGVGAPSWGNPKSATDTVVSLNPSDCTPHVMNVELLSRCVNLSGVSNPNRETLFSTFDITGWPCGQPWSYVFKEDEFSCHVAWVSIEPHGKVESCELQWNLLSLVTSVIMSLALFLTSLTKQQKQHQYIWYFYFESRNWIEII